MPVGALYHFQTFNINLHSIHLYPLYSFIDSICFARMSESVRSESLRGCRKISATLTEW